MATKRPFILPGSGSVIWNTRFSDEAVMTITGNVTLTLQGLDNGRTVRLIVTQDAVGSRTLTITPATGTTNRVVSYINAISSAANTYTAIEISNILGVYTLNYMNSTSGGGGGQGPAGRSIQVFTSLPTGTFGVNYFAGDVVIL